MCKGYQSVKLGVYFLIRGLLCFYCMNVTTNIAAQRFSSPLKSRASIPRDLSRLELVRSGLCVLLHVFCIFTHKKTIFRKYFSFSKAEIEVGSVEMDMLFWPSSTAFSDFIPTRKTAVFGGRHRSSGTSISFFASLVSLGETGLSHAKAAMFARKRKYQIYVFGTSFLDRYQAVCSAKGPRPK